MTASSTGTRWAILIGINGYHESLGPLKYSVSDCRLLADILTSGDDPLLSDHVLVLADDDQDPAHHPTYANIHSWLLSWLQQPTEDDTVIVYFAGHGRAVDDNCFLIPCDATLPTLDRTGIAVEYIQELLGKCPARRKILILDACHSGAGKDVGAMAIPMIDSLRGRDDIFTMTACDVDEISHECDQMKQSVFSHYLTKAFAGACPTDEQHRLSADAVYDWVAEKVHHWAAENRCRQTPKKITEMTEPVFIRHIETDWSEVASEHQAKLDGTWSKDHSTGENKSKESAAAAAARRKAILSNLPEWSEWMKTTWAEFFKKYGPVPIIVPLVLLIVFARLFIRSSLLITVVIIAFLFLWFASFINFLITIKSRNRYRKHCAEICLKARDWIGGADFALGIGQMGMDRTSVASLLVELAELADQNGDRETANQLYHRAMDKWDSPHARRIIQQRKKKEDSSLFLPFNMCRRMIDRFLRK